MNKITTLALLFLALSPLSAQINLDYDDATVSCLCDGHAEAAPFTLTAAGTAGPFRFKWTGPNGYVSYFQNPTNITDPGAYEVAVTNAFGCTTVLSATIPACPALELEDMPVSPAWGSAGGSVTAVVSGGTGAYGYLWSTGATTPSLTDVPAGAYEVTVTDANGCEVVGSATVGGSDELSVDLQPLVSCLCLGTSNPEPGWQTIITGGVAPFAFAWTGPDGFTSALADPLINDSGDC